MNFRHVSGPVTGDQTATGTQTPIEGLITRAAYDVAPIFSLGHVVANNQGATQANLLFFIRRNGLTNVRAFFVSCLITTQHTFNFSALLNPFPGYNIYTLDVQQLTGGLVTLNLLQSLFATAELPLWDKLPFGLSG